MKEEEAMSGPAEMAAVTTAAVLPAAIPAAGGNLTGDPAALPPPPPPPPNFKDLLESGDPAIKNLIQVRNDEWWKETILISPDGRMLGAIVPISFAAYY